MQQDKLPRTDKNKLESSNIETEQNTESMDEMESTLAKLGKAATGLLDAKTKAEKFNQDHGRILNVFSKDSSLIYAYSKDIDTYSFNGSTFTISVPLKWFETDDYDDGEIFFVNLHERAHFRDMRKNPKAWLDNFEEMSKTADSLADEYLKKHPHEKHSKDSIKHFYYGELHTLYNCLDDIYVNDMVKRDVPTFDDGGELSSNIVSLYQKAGYKDSDLTNQPLHQQFAFSLLRDEMVGKDFGNSIIDERVEAQLNKRQLGKTIRSIVKNDLRCYGEELTDPEKRYKTIRYLIEPTYLELLELALDEQEEEKNSQPQEGQQGDSSKGQQGDSSESQQGDSSEGQQGDSGEGQPNSGSDFNPFGDQSKTPELLGQEVDPETVREILDGMLEQDKIKSMNATERSKYEAQKARESFDKEHNISEDERKIVEKIRDSISAPRNEMKHFWKNIIGNSIKYIRENTKYQTKGTLDVASVIDHFADINRGQLKNLPIYERATLRPEVIDFPELIEVTLIVDCSGSMSSGGKIEASQKAAALLLYSLKDFNNELKSMKRNTETDSQVYLYGSSYLETKKLGGRKEPENSEAQIIKSISNISSDLGGNNEVSLLTKIEQSINDDKKRSIKEGKVKKIIFLITDGFPDDTRGTRAKLQDISKTGTTVIGFQVGTDGDMDKRMFDEVWADHDGSVKGIKLGNNISILPEKLMSELENQLGNIIV